METTSYFRPVPEKPAEEVRTFLKERAADKYNLIDVRQPGEHKKGHIPGSTLIPLGELPSRLAELDPSKPTIVYCRSGARSRSAAQVLLEAGFTDTVSMQGGMLAWEGIAAAGSPEAGMAYFSGTARPDDLISLAYALEDGTGRFYEGLLASVTDAQAHELFFTLVAAETHHKKTLVDLAARLQPGEKRVVVEASLISDSLGRDTMEGGVPVMKALSWAKGKPVRDILELCMSLEVNAYDLYIKMGNRSPDEEARHVFNVIAEEEKRHLDKLASLLDLGL
jgi:rhodanese-related sulfurtransferase